MSAPRNREACRYFQVPLRQERYQLRLLQELLKPRQYEVADCGCQGGQPLSAERAQ